MTPLDGYERPEFDPENAHYPPISEPWKSSFRVLPFDAIELAEGRGATWVRVFRATFFLRSVQFPGASQLLLLEGLRLDRQSLAHLTSPLGVESCLFPLVEMIVQPLQELSLDLRNGGPGAWYGRPRLIVESAIDFAQDKRPLRY